MTISIVTPWRNHPELIPDYEVAVAGADQVIVIDNASQPGPARQIESMLARLDAAHPNFRGLDYIRNDENRWFTAACNQGLALATGDIVVMLNNDIQALPEWLVQVERDCEADVLTGPSLGIKIVAGLPMVYVEGWCVAARREVWDRLGGWDAAAYPFPYWEDVDLAWRASQLGIGCRRGLWPIGHLSNVTSRHTAGAYDYSEANAITFQNRVRAARGGIMQEVVG